MSSSNLPGAERIEVVEPQAEPGVRWQPRVGRETLTFLNQLGELDQAGREQVRDKAVAVLRGCIPPGGGDETETGLVVGHIQSGKTMSFTAVAALARDNGFVLVVVITGTSVPLSTQSLERLKADLRLDSRPDPRSWLQLNNPCGQHARHALEDTLANWRDPEVPPAERQAVLITVMKQYQHLGHLNDLLRGVNLHDVVALVIDDEADQASLNNLVRRGRQSTTYRRLVELRQLLPRHTYVQYTATPQAPLLINLIDVLSPRFAEVLEPGPDYVGGREFFVGHPRLVRVIPANETPTRGNPLTEPPPTLLEAMRIFLLGAAAGLHLEAGRNRSMMVHPSQHRVLHSEFVRWVRATKKLWADLLSLPEADQDRQDLVEEFRASFEDLHATVTGLPDFAALLRVLRYATRATKVWELNSLSGKTPEVNWRAAYGHILVGGQAMDRGFTVEGLTVTYMPRGVGVRNADTIQQRARFFGYKQSYLGYCRIYLEAAAHVAYRRYVEHEDDIRARLTAHRAEGKPLTDWKRAFFLDAALQPTRRSVLGLDYLQGTIENDWYWPVAPHHAEDAAASNREVCKRFLSGLALRPTAGHPKRTEMEKHEVAEGVSLSVAYQELLTLLRITYPADSQRFTGLLLQIRSYLDSDPSAVCQVYRMSPGMNRARGLDDKGERIRELFQGANPVAPRDRRGAVYPGDREIRAAEGVTIQFHRLDITQGKPPRLVLGDVPAVAVWVPSTMARTWLVQDEPS